MADGTLTLKALINKEENKVIFVESGSDFVEILFSFLTMPVGEMVRLIRGLSSSKLKMGCMNNLHRSVETLDLNLFRSKMCQTMLLQPKSAAPFLCNSLERSIGFGDSMSYYSCVRSNFGMGEQLSYYNGQCNYCGVPLSEEIIYGPRGEAFLDRFTRFLVSDELDVVTATSAASFSLVSKVQMKDLSLAEERTFHFGKKEVMDLLYHSLVSNKPLTETFLQQEMTPQSSKKDGVQGICIDNDVGDGALEGKPAICIKLFVSKSRGAVCYAEASNEFIDLLFSFLTVPFGYAQKISGSGASLGSLGHLCKSVQNCLKSADHKEFLLNPKIPKYFGYKNQLLGIEEVNYQFLLKSFSRVVVDTTSNTPSINHTKLALADPKPVIGSEVTNGGFLRGIAMFTVTDDLIITPISPVLSLSILNKMNVACSDVEELDVFVGEKEASRLLLAALTSQSALTEVFLSEGSKNGAILKEPKKEF